MNNKFVILKSNYKQTITLTFQMHEKQAVCFANVRSFPREYACFHSSSIRAKHKSIIAFATASNSSIGKRSICNCRYAYWAAPLTFNWIPAYLKPQNVLIDCNNRAIIGDFGLVLDFKNNKQKGIYGTPLYQSPEQLEDKYHLDERVDIFNVGVIFYEMIVGIRRSPSQIICWKPQQTSPR